MTGWMNTYQVEVRDEKGDVMDSVIVEAVDLQRALERTARTFAARTTSRDQRAARLTVELMQRKRT